MNYTVENFPVHNVFFLLPNNRLLLSKYGGSKNATKNKFYKAGCDVSPSACAERRLAFGLVFRGPGVTNRRRFSFSTCSIEMSIREKQLFAREPGAKNFQRFEFTHFQMKLGFNPGSQLVIS